MSDVGLPVIQIFGVWLLSCAVLVLATYLNHRKQPKGWTVAETDHDQ